MSEERLRELKKLGFITQDEYNRQLELLKRK